MSRKPDDLDLEYIRELAKSSQKVQDILSEKTYELKQLEKSEKGINSYPSPQLTPSDDVRFSKTKNMQKQSEENFNKVIQEVEGKHNKELKSALEEKAFEMDKDYIHPIIQDIDNDNLATLIEKGSDAYKVMKQEKEQYLEQPLSFDLDDRSKFDDYSIYYDFDDNSKDMDIEKNSSPSDEFE